MCIRDRHLISKGFQTKGGGQACVGMIVMMCHIFHESTVKATSSTLCELFAVIRRTPVHVAGKRKLKVWGHRSYGTMTLYKYIIIIIIMNPHERV